MNILDLDYFNTCECLQNTRGGLLSSMALPPEESIHVVINDNMLTLYEEGTIIVSQELKDSPRGISVSWAGAPGISTRVRTVRNGQNTTSTVFIRSETELPPLVMNRFPVF
jgi:hypothetical protein